MRVSGHSPSGLTLLNGVPKDSVLGLLLFSLYINNLSVNAHETNTHFYADDKLLYSCGSSLPDTLHTYSPSLIFCSLSTLNSN